MTLGQERREGEHAQMGDTKKKRTKKQSHVVPQPEPGGEGPAETQLARQEKPVSEKQKKDRQKPLKVKRLWPVLEPITDKERISMGDRLAMLQADVATIGEEKKDMMGEFKRRLKAVDDEIKSIATTLREGKKQVQKNCWVEKNLATGILKVIDTSTKKVIEERPMREDERQGDLL